MQELQDALPQVLMAPVPARCNTGEVVEALLGTCLQTILERHGSGLEGLALTEEFNKLLALVRQNPCCLCSSV